MKAIIKKGKEHLFLEGASGKNLEDLRDVLIINCMNKWTYKDYYFQIGRLYIVLHSGDVIIAFSSPIKGVELQSYEKDQLIFKLIK